MKPALLRRAVVTAALLVTVAAPLTGCGARMPFFHRRPGPAVPRSAAPSVPAAAVAHERNEADASHPYWAYERARRAGADSAGVAEDELRRALGADPSYAPALALLSKHYYESGRHAEGVALLAVVLREPGSFDAKSRARLLSGLALHQDALGNAAEAREALVMAREASEREALAAEVYVTLRGSSPDSAAARARELARHEPRSAAGQNNVGITLLRSGDVDGARRAFETAIERDPSLPGSYYNLAILEKYWRFDDEAAARRFAEYWSLSHDDPDGLSAVFTRVVAQATPQKGDRR